MRAGKHQHVGADGLIGHTDRSVQCRIGIHRGERTRSPIGRVGVRSLSTCLSLNVMSSCRHHLLPTLSSRYCVTTVESGKLHLHRYVVGANWVAIISRHQATSGELKRSISRVQQV
jgi:hypothetical protein